MTCEQSLPMTYQERGGPYGSCGPMVAAGAGSAAADWSTGSVPWSGGRSGWAAETRAGGGRGSTPALRRRTGRARLSHYCI